jgi:hypothetical protein
MVAGNGKGRMQFGDWWKAVIWAPYDKPNYTFKWLPYLITLFHVYVLAAVMSTVIPNIASLSTSTSPGLNAITVALLTGAILLLGMSVRSADYLPQLMHPALAFVEWIHGHLGVVVALPMIALMFAGSATGAPILTGIGGTDLPNYAAGVRPISYWGAVAEQTSLVAFVIYMFLFNTPVKHYHLVQGRKPKNYVGAFKKTSIFFALAHVIAICISYGNGLYSVGNFVVTFGSYINTGNWNVPDTAACTLDLAWPFVGGLAAWALHLLTWNVKGLTMEDLQEAVEEEDGENA